MYMRNGLHLCGKGQQYLRTKLSAAVDSGIDSITTIILVVNIEEEHWVT